MKRTAIILALCLMLTACAAAPVPTDPKPPETTLLPIGVTVPQTTTPSDTAPATEPSVPAETAPVETLPTEPAPVETTAPAFESYAVKLTDPELGIYDGPGFAYGVTALLEEAGVYTIVEEATDADGNLWGWLKSGVGWVCLTEPATVPIFAQYAPDRFTAAYEWHCGETEYVTAIGILANETVTDVAFTSMVLTETMEIGDTLYTVDTLQADEALLVSVVFPGDMTAYGLSFTDAKGNERYFALSISGKDGSLVCTEYTP